MQNILLVDDDAFHRKVIEYILSRAGYDVISCESGDDARQQLGLKDFLVVISDFRMGRVSGLDVAQAAAKRKPPIPVFIVTAYSDKLIGGLAGDEVSRVFDKPVDLKALLNAVKSLESSRGNNFNKPETLPAD